MENFGTLWWTSIHVQQPLWRGSDFDMDPNDSPVGIGTRKGQMGVGPKITPPEKNAGTSPFSHLPGFQSGYQALTHTHLGLNFTSGPCGGHHITWGFLAHQPLWRGFLMKCHSHFASEHLLGNPLQHVPSASKLAHPMFLSERAPAWVAGMITQAVRW